jgi:hypothetical protein
LVRRAAPTIDLNPAMLIIPFVDRAVRVFPAAADPVWRPSLALCPARSRKPREHVVSRRVNDGANRNVPPVAHWGRECAPGMPPVNAAGTGLAAGKTATTASVVPGRRVGCERLSSTTQICPAVELPPLLAARQAPYVVKARQTYTAHRHTAVHRIPTRPIDAPFRGRPPIYRRVSGLSALGLAAFDERPGLPSTTGFGCGIRWGQGLAD